LIPKIIHYCWFGSAIKPGYFFKCYKSWVKFFPGFEILEWNESNTDLSHPFLQEAVRQEKWAFLSDFVRIQKLLEKGGVYLDTDMLFVKQLEVSLLDYQFFIGMENSNSLSAGVIGIEKDHLIMSNLLDVYNGLVFDKFEEVIIPGILNKYFSSKVAGKLIPGNVLGGIILPYMVFYPLPFKLKDFHYRKFLREDTIAVHLWAGSWIDNENKSFFNRLLSFVKFNLSRFYIPSSFISFSRNI